MKYQAQLIKRPKSKSELAHQDQIKKFLRNDHLTNGRTNIEAVYDIGGANNGKTARVPTPLRKNGRGSDDDNIGLGRMLYENLANNNSNPNTNKKVVHNFRKYKHN